MQLSHELRTPETGLIKLKIINNNPAHGFIALSHELRTTEAGLI